MEAGYESIKKTEHEKLMDFLEENTGVVDRYNEAVAEGKQIDLLPDLAKFLFLSMLVEMEEGETVDAEVAIETLLEDMLIKKQVELSGPVAKAVTKGWKSACDFMKTV